MHAKQSDATESECYPDSLAETLVSTVVKIEQTAISICPFPEKYEAMLDMVEFIASYHLLSLEDSGQAERMRNLKSMVAEVRNRMEACRAGVVDAPPG